MLGPARVHVAVAARSRAGVAEDLEGGRAAPPALGDVRAAGLLADRVQVLAVDQLLHVEVARVRARRAHLHPLRAARPLGDGQRLLHVCQSKDRGSRGAAREHEVRPSSRRRGLVRHERAERAAGATRRRSARSATSRASAASRASGSTSTFCQPGQPMGLYHRENAQEDFLVLAGECLLIVEGEERELKTWDFFHCPPGDGAHHRRRRQGAGGRAGRRRARAAAEGPRLPRLRARRWRRRRRRSDGSRELRTGSGAYQEGWHRSSTRQSSTRRGGRLTAGRQPVEIGLRAAGS